MPRGTIAASRRVECVIVDGAMPETGEDTESLVSRCTVGFPKKAGEPAQPGDAQHTPMCAATIGSVFPSPRLHVVQVFKKDGYDAPASRILKGLERAAGMQVHVICCPWTIGDTRLVSRFHEVCKKIALEGKIVVAAWATGIERAVPASFKSVVGVASSQCVRSAIPSLIWLDEPGIVATPLVASRGTALVSGLAMSFVKKTQNPNRDLFVDTLRDFPLSNASVVRPERFRFDRFAKRLAHEYRQHLDSRRETGS